MQVSLVALLIPGVGFPHQGLDESLTSLQLLLVENCICTH